MSYIGMPWDEQKTVRGKMRTVVSQFLRNFSNASEDDWELFFRESERHLRRFAKYTVRYNDLPRAEEIYHQLVADLKDKFALSEERTYDSFRAVLYAFFRGCSRANICDAVRKVDGYLQAEMRKFRDFRG